MTISKEIKGVLFDLDGVLYVGSQAIPGAIETVSTIRNSGIDCRFVTNTSTLSLQSLQEKINRMGFSIPAHEIISAPQATVLYLKQQGKPVCRLLLSEDVKKDFSDFEVSDQSADYIVVGDIGNAWSYSLLNSVFNQLMNGAKLIAIHKNRFWQTEQGLQMDIGGFVEALEYVSNTKAMIIGKPSPDFFKIAQRDIGVEPHELLMIGDDIDVDVGGAQQAGLAGVLVKTGKYRSEYASASSINPDAVIDSIAQLPELLGIKRDN